MDIDDLIITIKELLIKNLTITWEDIKKIDILLNDVDFENRKAETAGKDIPYDSDESFYGEALKRFNEQR